VSPVWPVHALREVGVTLLDCEHRTPPATPGGYPYVAIPQLKDGRLDLTDVRRISRKDFEEWTRKTRPQAGDVIVSRRCNPGESAFVPHGLELALGQNLVLLRADGSAVLPDFLRWLARSPAWWEQVQRNLNVGAIFDSLKCKDIPEFRIPVPPLREQQAIAEVLGALDDNIALNRRMTQTLDAMAQALFESWFVDFDPVRAKAEGRQPAGVGAQTAALFPSELTDSDFGLVPKGWRIGSLGEYVGLKRGTTYNGMLVGKPGPALLGLGSIRPGGGFRSEGFKTYGGECPPELMLRSGDIYVSLKGATKDGEMIGSVASVPMTVPSGRLTQDTVKLEFRDRTISRYVYRLLLTPEYRAYCANRATGSAVVALSRADFLSYAMVLPSDAVLEEFNGVIAALESKAEHGAAECADLAATRDALLPKLLSGKVRVKDAEAAVAATV
jgi:type I restriction enzyme, S subunit